MNGFLAPFSRRPHLEPNRDNNFKAMIEYCRKEETRVAGPWSVGDEEKVLRFGKRGPAKKKEKSPEEPGRKKSRREKLEEVGEELQNYEFLEDVPLALRLDGFGQQVDKIAMEIQEERNAKKIREMRVVCVVGDSGWGKSRTTALMLNEEPWRVQQVVGGSATNVWLSDVARRYDVLWLDEFSDKQFDLQMFNRLVDGNPIQIQSKGKQGHASYDKVVICSNFAPRNWWKRTCWTLDEDGHRIKDEEAQEDWNRRRISALRRIGAASTGIAGDEPQGYYIDLPSLDELREGQRELGIGGQLRMEACRFRLQETMRHWLKGWPKAAVDLMWEGPMWFDMEHEIQRVSAIECPGFEFIPEDEGDTEVEQDLDVLEDVLGSAQNLRSYTNFDWVADHSFGSPLNFSP